MELAGIKSICKKMRLWEITPEVDVRIEPILIEKKDLEKEQQLYLMKCKNMV